MSQKHHRASLWQRFEIKQIEDLSNAVLAAELEAFQMHGPRVRGSLAFAARDGIIFSTGLINGKVSINGPFSRDEFALTIGLRFGPGSRFWFSPISDGDIGILSPGEISDALITSGSLYIVLTASKERFEAEADRQKILINRNMFVDTGFHSERLPRRILAQLRSEVLRLHDRPASAATDAGICSAAFRAAIGHYSRFPDCCAVRKGPVGRGKIVVRAREYICNNLDSEISLQDLTLVSETSRRTLIRAFIESLDETPASYVRRLRLHRIRRDLASDAQTGRTISEIAAAWGINEAGRMAGWYRELFGEYPSDTLKAHSARRRHEMVL